MTEKADDHFELINANDWVSLKEYLRRTYPITAEIFADVEHRMMINRTRRTVQVATRKYRARKRRKR